MSMFEELQAAIRQYDASGAAEITTRAMDAAQDPLEALDAITEVLTDIGERFGSGELYLPDLVGAAHAAQTVIPILEKTMSQTGVEAKTLGTIVIGTVSGDIHDIGKSMVSALLIAHGFRVIDLGTDVATTTFLEAIKTNNPDIVALSALLTTTARQVEKVIESIAEAGYRDKLKILAGGGAVNADFAAQIGADCYGETAAEGVTLARELLGITD
jgi:corrinoid protein of di/trimethylamine methyltransferase